MPFGMPVRWLVIILGYAVALFAGSALLVADGWSSWLVVTYILGCTIGVIGWQRMGFGRPTRSLKEHWREKIEPVPEDTTGRS